MIRGRFGRGGIVDTVVSVAGRSFYLGLPFTFSLEWGVGQKMGSFTDDHKAGANGGFT